MAVPAAYEDFNFIVNWGGTNQRMISGLDGDGSAFVVERLTLEYDSWSRKDGA